MNDGKYDRKWFVDFIEAAQKESLDIVRAKNADYAAGDDPFQNFGLFEYVFRNIDLNKCDKTEIALMVRMLDKVQRIANLMERSPQVKDESKDDTLKDLANYSLIDLAYNTSRRQNHA